MQISMAHCSDMPGDLCAQHGSNSYRPSGPAPRCWIGHPWYVRNPHHDTLPQSITCRASPFLHAPLTRRLSPAHSLGLSCISLGRPVLSVFRSDGQSTVDECISRWGSPPSISTAMYSLTAFQCSRPLLVVEFQSRSKWPVPPPQAAVPSSHHKPLLAIKPGRWDLCHCQPIGQANGLHRRPRDADLYSASRVHMARAAQGLAVAVQDDQADRRICREGRPGCPHIAQGADRDLAIAARFADGVSGRRRKVGRARCCSPALCPNERHMGCIER